MPSQTHQMGRPWYAWHLPQCKLGKQVSCLTFYKRGPMCRSKACPKHCRHWALQVKVPFFGCLHFFFLQSFHDPWCRYQNLCIPGILIVRWTPGKTRSFVGWPPGKVRYGIPSLSASLYLPQSLNFSSSSADKTCPGCIFIVIPLEWLRHVIIHTQVQIRHYNNRCLQSFHKIKSFRHKGKKHSAGVEGKAIRVWYHHVMYMLPQKHQIVGFR